jgi:hypothetical protein
MNTLHLGLKTSHLILYKEKIAVGFVGPYKTKKSTLWAERRIFKH